LSVSLSNYKPWHKLLPTENETKPQGFLLGPSGVWDVISLRKGQRSFPLLDSGMLAKQITSLSFCLFSKMGKECQSSNLVVRIKWCTACILV
jgi:hypothetical protein